MCAFRSPSRLSLFLIALLGASGSASAAESYDSCAGFIDAVPAIVTTHGNWCLRHNVNTSATSVHAIEIDTDNVTIDCNGFKITNNGAGTDTNSVGIFADGVANITVRHCTVQGFHDGISIDFQTAETGHLIEDNLLSQNRANGMFVLGSGSIVRRNRVLDTGGNSANTSSFGIKTSGDVIDNVVDGMSPASSTPLYEPTGIQTIGSGGSLVQGNRVRNLTTKGGGLLQNAGIQIATGTGTEVRDNYVIQSSATNGTGILCVAGNRARDNVIHNWDGGLSGCSDDGGNKVD